MRKIPAAFSLLTILPVFGFQTKTTDLERCVGAFPIVGLVLGGLSYAMVSGLLFTGIPQMPIAVCILVMLEIFSKFFHLDGLADTADGFFSGRSQERILEIMHDSRIGSMGVAAIVLIFLLKFSVFSALPRETLPLAAALAAFSGRTGIVFYIAFSRYARPSGLGKILFERPHRWDAVFAFLFFAGICATVNPNLLPLAGLLPGAALLWKGYTDRMIGGATGDTIGGFEELSETMSLFYLLFLLC